MFTNKTKGANPLSLMNDKEYGFVGRNVKGASQALMSGFEQAQTNYQLNVARAGKLVGYFEEEEYNKILDEVKSDREKINLQMQIVAQTAGLNNLESFGMQMGAGVVEGMFDPVNLAIDFATAGVLGTGLKMAKIGGKTAKGLNFTGNLLANTTYNAFMSTEFLNNEYGHEEFIRDLAVGLAFTGSMVIGKKALGKMFGKGTNADMMKAVQKADDKVRTTDRTLIAKGKATYLERSGAINALNELVEMRISMGEPLTNKDISRIIKPYGDDTKLSPYKLFLEDNANIAKSEEYSRLFSELGSFKESDKAFPEKMKKIGEIENKLEDIRDKKNAKKGKKRSKGENKQLNREEKRLRQEVKELKKEFSEEIKEIDTVIKKFERMNEVGKELDLELKSVLGDDYSMEDYFNKVHDFERQGYFIDDNELRSVLENYSDNTDLGSFEMKSDTPNQADTVEQDYKAIKDSPDLDKGVKSIDEAIERITSADVDDDSMDALIDLVDCIGG